MENSVPQVFLPIFKKTTWTGGPWSGIIWNGTNDDFKDHQINPEQNSYIYLVRYVGDTEKKVDADIQRDISSSELKHMFSIEVMKNVTGDNTDTNYQIPIYSGYQHREAGG